MTKDQKEIQDLKERLHKKDLEIQRLECEVRMLRSYFPPPEYDGRLGGY